MICSGCSLAAHARGMPDCPFCRAPLPETDADKLAMIRARVEKRDPVAINNLGTKYYEGELGLQKDMRKGVELLTEAAVLGSIDALYNLGVAYNRGEGVEQDEEKGGEYYKKLPCKDMFRAGTTLAVGRERGEISTAQ